jgi:TnpA family transposase
MAGIGSRFVGLEKLPSRLSRFDVEAFFSLSSDDVASIKARFRSDRHVGVALQLVFLRATGRTLDRLAVLAVDTHGYTHVGMAFAKLLHFDLCPRLKSLPERKLYIPRDLDVPDTLEPVVAREVSWRPIELGWNELVRAAASLKSGRVSAVVLMQRLGSAAKEICCIERPTASASCCARCTYATTSRSRPSGVRSISCSTAASRCTSCRARSTSVGSLRNAGAAPTR